MASPPTSDLPTIFSDSSVLIAAAISARGFARDLLLAGVRQQLRVVVTPLVLTENGRNLLAKAPAAWPAFQQLEQILVQEPDPPQALVEDVAR